MEKINNNISRGYCELITNKDQIYQTLDEIQGKEQSFAMIDSLLRIKTDKVEGIYKAIAELGYRGINTYFANYYNIQDTLEADRKSWEISNEVRPVPVGELDIHNNIYLNIKEIGYLSSFLTLLHLYGHRVQSYIMDTYPTSKQGKEYHAITKYVSRPKPLKMNDVYDDYHQTIGRDSDYEQDFLEFEKEAFSFGIGLCEYIGISVDDNLHYLINVFVETDFDEIKQRWSTKPNKSGLAFNERYLYNYKNNRHKIGAGYQTIGGKESVNISVKDFISQSGVTVIRG